MIFWPIYVTSHSRGPAFSVHGKGWWKPRGWPHPGAASVLNSRASPSRLKAIHRMARGRNGPSVWGLSLRSSAVWNAELGTVRCEGSRQEGRTKASFLPSGLQEPGSLLPSSPCHRPSLNRTLGFFRELLCQTFGNTSVTYSKKTTVQYISL